MHGDGWPLQCVQNVTTGAQYGTPTAVRIGAFNQTNAESKAGTDLRTAIERVVHPGFRNEISLGAIYPNNDIALLLLNDSSTKQVIRLPAMQGNLLPSVCNMPGQSPGSECIGAAP